LDILSTERPGLQLPKVLGRVTKDQLELLLSHLKDDFDLIKRRGPLLQIIVAAIESMEEMYVFCIWRKMGF
jgi:hypothetical protein